jgi:hypothetical protein
VGEILNDYRETMNSIAAIRTNPTAQEYNEEGFVALRQCCAMAQALLAKPFVSATPTTQDPEQVRAGLSR